MPLDEKMKPGELDELIQSKEAHTNAVVLESVRNNLIFSVIFFYLTESKLYYHRL